MLHVPHNLTKAEKRKARVRSKIFGTAAKPRLTVFRSNKHLYLQAINDDSGKTVASANDVRLRKDSKLKKTKTEIAAMIAAEMAKALKQAKVQAVVFDRGAYRYHGRVKAVAETLRSEGIKV